MRNKTAHIALIYILLANLLFNQVGLNFYHDKHDAHETTVKLPDGKAAVQKHGDHCKLCALDLLSHFFLPSFSSFYFPAYEKTSIAFNTIGIVTVASTFTQDRAPPAAI